MRGTSNWTFKDIVKFLELNYFRLIKTEGSHHYYLGMISGEETVVEVQYHANSVIKKGTLEKSIIVQSRIPSKEWKEYAKLPSNKRKKYHYEKCELHSKFK